MSVGKAIVLIAGGAAIGSGVTVLVLKKKYAAKAEAEIASVRDAYLQRINDMEAEFDKVLEDNDIPPVAPVEKHPEEADVPMERVVPTNDQLRRAYHKMSSPNPETVEGLKETNEALGYSRKEDEVKEAEARNVIRSEEVDKDSPYVIPVQAYLDGEEEMYEQFVLTYYTGDGTLCYEDTGQVVEDVDQTVGFHNLHNFGVESGNDDTVYVRNDKKETEYEILRDERKYSEVVGGIDTWGDSPDPKKPIRKFV
ncbi:hypothetical protein SEA_MEDIUMFRY_53 [Arthrobacter phage MediumFry]|nr:hypothetical protein SEA_CATERPILLAR_52 [Arthrobacter phage Caterpillar]AXH44599.1 hypothetical protein SEA_MEDIUMFRY_53 [Arthrobacter phage MediumFry]